MWWSNWSLWNRVSCRMTRYEVMNGLIGNHTRLLLENFPYHACQTMITVMMIIADYSFLNQISKVSSPLVAGYFCGGLKNFELSKQMKLGTQEGESGKKRQMKSNPRGSVLIDRKHFPSI